MRLLAALMVILGFPLLTTAATAQVINGCVKDSNGALRIVADPADCTLRETPISWNQVGPQGEPGEPGIDGEPGADGADADVLRVFDATGAELGLYASGGRADEYLGQHILIFHEAAQVIFEINQYSGILDLRYIGLRYEDTGCEGTPHIESGTSPDFFAGGVLFGTGRGLMAFENATLPAVKTIRAVINDRDGACSPITDQDLLVVPVREIDLGLSFPVALPIYVGLAPEPAP